MIVDRESGAQRDLLAAPAPRSLMVFGNLAVALAVSLFQVIALIGASVARGSTFSTGLSGWIWAAAAVIGLATFMHGLAESWPLASRGRRNTSAPHRPWRCCPGSSPAASFRSAPCRWG
jgi:hypothetical protein